MRRVLPTRSALLAALPSPASAQALTADDWIARWPVPATAFVLVLSIVILFIRAARQRSRDGGR